MSATTITNAEAILLVRKNLDEAEPNGSEMYGVEQDETSDNNSLDDIIKKSLPEAINEVHRAAPVHLLDALEQAGPASSGVAITANNFLRLVACVGSTNGIALSDAILESSVEARKQADPYIQATADRPRLVRCLGGEGAVAFKYYGDSATLYFVPILAITTGGSYEYSSQLKQNIIDWLTAKVMETYGDQRAQSYYQRALTFH